ncbi:MAG: HAMP domain-containing sensor histidine kinase [Chthoniobacteraceae bacterium]
MTVARRILLHVALGAAFVIAVVTAVTYTLVYEALKQRDLQLLATYVNERAQREEARFQQVETNLRLVRGQFLKRLERPLAPEQVEERFNYWYRRYEDGAWRSREQFGDARKTSSMWADRDWPATSEMRRQTLIAQELCDEMLPGWVDVFPSYYFQFPAPGLVNVGVDVLLADWSWKMPAHFDTTGLEWIAAALPADVAQPDAFRWTGIQSDDVISEPLVCVFLPVVKDGVFLASVGHNMNMSRMIDAAARSEIPGASHFLFRADGRLIAHPTKRSEILASKGLLTAQSCGDAALASLYRIASTHSERRFAGFDAASATYYNVARLAGPEWFYVTAMSRDHLQAQASASARWVLWSGLTSLALVLIAIATVLRNQVTRPLAKLNQAAKAMSAGAREVPVAIDRHDELGELAASFREMVDKVVAREGDLRQLNLDLEKRVTERTADLNAALSREREVGEMKSRFTSLVSHEFRTPLGVISSSAQILERYLARLDDDERREHLESINASVKRMAGMMEEMLVLSRMDSGRMDFKPAPLALGDLCRRLLDELHSAHGSSAQLTVAPDAEPPACADETLVRHILNNLLTNAHKYSPPGAPVKLTLSREDHDAVFTVRDEGIGIPAADQAQLFEAFHRGSNVGAVSGTGLGLVVVRRSCELHGGTVTVASHEGAGTTFTVRLPVFG